MSFFDRQKVNTALNSKESHQNYVIPKVLVTSSKLYELVVEPLSCLFGKAKNMCVAAPNAIYEEATMILNRCFLDITSINTGTQPKSLSHEAQDHASASGLKSI